MVKRTKRRYTKYSTVWGKIISITNKLNDWNSKQKNTRPTKYKSDKKERVKKIKGTKVLN